MLDWQTDDPESWNKPFVSSMKPNHAPATWVGRWSGALLTLLIITLSLGALTHLSARRSGSAQDAARREVAASVRFLYQTADLGDEEVAATLISAREPDWARDTQKLIASGLFSDRPALGLQASGPITIETITVFPDLRQAEVEIVRLYTLLEENGGARALLLHHIHNYRLGETRWLLTPPEANGTSRIHRYDGQHIAVEYPADEAALALALGPLLVGLSVQLCADYPAPICQPGGRQVVTLENTPRALLFMTEPDPSKAGALPSVLPGMAAVGLPPEAWAVQSVAHSHARLVAAALIREQVGYNCCQGSRFYHALLQARLADLGLAPSPLEQEEFVRLWEKGDSFQQTVRNLTTEWGQPAPASILTPTGPTLAAFVRFMTSLDPALGAANIQAALTPERGYFQWLAALFAILPEQVSNQTLERAWLELLRAGAGAEPPASLSLPEVRLVCAPFSNRVQQLFTFDPATEKTTWISEAGSIIGLRSSRTGDIVVTRLPGGGFAIARLQDHQPRTIYQSSATLVRLGETDSANNWLPLLIRPQDAPLQVIALDLDGCAAARCQATLLPGWPTWSLDGSQMILRDQATGQLYWSSDVQAQPVRLETPPALEAIVWSGKERFIYASQPGADRDSQALIQYDLGVHRWTPLADVRSLQEQVDERNLFATSFAGMIVALVSTPAMPEAIFVAAHDANNNGIGDLVLARLEIDGGRWDILESRAQVSRIAPVLSLSPDGQWLALRTRASLEPAPLLGLYALEEDRQVLISIDSDEYAWSPDARWLALPEDRLLQLYDMEHMTGYRLIHGISGCSEMAWKVE